jgi:hypothetical protein
MSDAARALPTCLHTDAPVRTPLCRVCLDAFAAKQSSERARPDRYPEVTLREKHTRACEDRDGWKRRAGAAEALVGRMRDLLEQWHESWKKGDEGDHLDAPTTALLADAGQAGEEWRALNDLYTAVKADAVGCAFFHAQLDAIGRTRQR